MGCIAGPQLFLAYEKPLYRTAMNTIIGMCEYLSRFYCTTVHERLPRQCDRVVRSSGPHSGKISRADLFILFSPRADAVYFVSMLAYREICRRENNRRDRLAANGCAEAVARPAEKEDNKSDIDDLAFRYIL